MANLGSFDENSMIDAMCIWEALLDHELLGEQTSGKNIYTTKREDLGTNAMRQVVLDILLEPIQAGWNEIGDEFQDAFDWEYIPAFLNKATHFLDKPEPWVLTQCQGIAIAISIQADRNVSKTQK